VAVQDSDWPTKALTPLEIVVVRGAAHTAESDVEGQVAPGENIRVLSP
jgi:hypothetical protein